MSPKKDQIPDLLFHTAQGFYDIALHCALDVSSDKASVQGFQRIAPAAVNICFAAELLLKGLTLISTKQGVRGHHLQNLFNNLSDELKKLIQSKYVQYQEEDKENKELGAMKIVIAKANKQENNLAEKDNSSLEHLLESHNKGFENWRYLYEIETDGFVYEIDFRSMNCFIKAIVDAINSIPARPRLYLSKPFVSDGIVKSSGLE